MDVLYIDDDRKDQKFFKDALKVVAPETTCHIAKDSRSALDLLSSILRLPKYIFVDFNMLNTEGKTLLQKLKDSKFCNIPVIVFSNTSNSKDRAECEKLGAKEFWTKPTSYNGILELLNDFGLRG